MNTKVTLLLLFIIAAPLAALGLTARSLHRFGKLADLDTTFSFKRIGSELHIFANATVTNPTEKNITIRQPYIRIFSKAKKDRLPDEGPITFSNISNTEHVLQPFQSTTFETITLKVGALGLTKLVRDMINQKSVALHIDTILNVNGIAMTQRKELKAQI